MRMIVIVAVVMVLVFFVVVNESHNPMDHREPRFNRFRLPLSERRRSNTLAELLSTIARVLRGARVRPGSWWLDGGTLLGAVRDSGGYIPVRQPTPPWRPAHVHCLCQFEPPYPAHGHRANRHIVEWLLSCCVPPPARPPGLD